MEARGSGRCGQGVEPQSEHSTKPHEEAGNNPPRHPRHLTAREISLPRSRRGLHVALRPFKNLPALFSSDEPVLVVARRLLNDPYRDSRDCKSRVAKSGGGSRRGQTLRKFANRVDGILLQATAVARTQTQTRSDGRNVYRSGWQDVSARNIGRPEPVGSMF